MLAVAQMSAGCVPVAPGGGGVQAIGSSTTAVEAPAAPTPPAVSVAQAAAGAEELRSDEQHGAEALYALAGAQTAEAQPAGYDRDRFGYGPSDALDDDGCWTRDRVLIVQAVQPPTVAAGCRIVGGAWLSPYDAAVHHSPRGLQIDHLVPLFEAWQSGAHAWSEQQLAQYANDSWDGRALVAVTAELNVDKSASGPEEWMPPDPAARCWYVWAWATVKQRWALSYDEAELSAVQATAAACAGGAADQ